MQSKITLGDIAVQSNVSSDKMDELNLACTALIEAITDIARIESALKIAKEKMSFIESVQIPDIMDSMNLETFTLKGGKKVLVKRDVHASIKVENRPAAFTWLEDNEFGDLIKTEVSVKFNREDHELSAQLMEELSSREFAVSLDNSVHAATLKKFVKDQIEEGNEVPAELFGVFFTRKATIK